MSGIYIKGMEMPTSCFYCPFREKVNPDDYVCMALNKEFEETFSLIVGKRHKDCPLTPVPEHGDLIDRDTLLDDGPEIHEDYVDSDGYCWDSVWGYTEEQIKSAPTIIPSSKEGEG